MDFNWAYSECCSKTFSFLERNLFSFPLIYDKNIANIFPGVIMLTIEGYVFVAALQQRAQA